MTERIDMGPTPREWAKQLGTCEHLLLRFVENQIDAAVMIEPSLRRRAADYLSRPFLTPMTATEIALREALELLDATPFERRDHFHRRRRELEG